MATPAQIDANRRNAQHSTGPRTPQGKERSSRNATTFGLFCSRLLLPDEDPAELDALRAGIFDRLDPADTLEGVSAERVVAAAWRLRRALSGEAAVFARWKSRRMTAAQALAAQYPMEDLDRLQKHVAALERAMDRAVAELRRLQQSREADGPAADGPTADGPVADGDDHGDPSIAKNEPDRPPQSGPPVCAESEHAQGEPLTAASASIEIVKTNPIEPMPALEAFQSEGPNEENEPNTSRVAPRTDAAGGT